MFDVFTFYRTATLIETRNYFTKQLLWLTNWTTSKPLYLRSEWLWPGVMGISAEHCAIEGNCSAHGFSHVYIYKYRDAYSECLTLWLCFIVGSTYLGGLGVWWCDISGTDCWTWWWSCYSSRRVWFRCQIGSH